MLQAGSVAAAPRVATPAVQHQARPSGSRAAQPVAAQQLSASQGAATDASTAQQSAAGQGTASGPSAAQPQAADSSAAPAAPLLAAPAQQTAAAGAQEVAGAAPTPPSAEQLVAAVRGGSVPTSFAAQGAGDANPTNPVSSPASSGGASAGGQAPPRTLGTLGSPPAADPGLNPVVTPTPNPALPSYAQLKAQAAAAQRATAEAQAARGAPKVTPELADTSGAAAVAAPAPPAETLPPIVLPPLKACDCCNDTRSLFNCLRFLSVLWRVLPLGRHCVSYSVQFTLGPAANAGIRICLAVHRAETSTCPPRCAADGGCLAALQDIAAFFNSLPKLPALPPAPALPPLPAYAYTGNGVGMGSVAGASPTTQPQARPSLSQEFCNNDKIRV